MSLIIMVDNTINRKKNSLRLLAGKKICLSALVFGDARVAQDNIDDERREPTTGGRDLAAVWP